jgi:hypothetical protein
MRSLIILVAVLSGCATGPSPELRNTYLVCGSTVRVNISHDGVAAFLQDSDGVEVTLRRSTSEFGTRYEGGGVSVLRSGDVYIYTTRDGTTLNCDILPRARS